MIFEGAFHPLRDRQQDRPVALCELCQREQYAYDRTEQQNGLLLCQTCAARELTQEEDDMTLLELSVEYRSQAERLRARIRELEAARKLEKDSDERERLQWRIRTLSEIFREARDLAVLTERYYERGYRRNGRYTL